MNGDSLALAYDTGAATDRGCVRPHNEDGFLAQPETGIWAVADGMGGHDAGDVASRLIVEELASVGMSVSALDQRARLAERIGRANQSIRRYALDRGLVTVGSTLAALTIHGVEFGCIWAGDSRVYLLRRGVLHRLTTDHSRIAQMIAAGELTEDQARHSTERNVITRAIGINDQPDPEIVTGVVEPGDIYLLCSDGLTEHNSDADLLSLLSQPLSASELAQSLIGQTLMRGARDNVTAVVVSCMRVAGSETEAEG